jgi:hypothetical protein
MKLTARLYWVSKIGLFLKSHKNCTAEIYLSYVFVCYVCALVCYVCVLVCYECALFLVNLLQTAHLSYVRLLCYMRPVGTKEGA